MEKKNAEYLAYNGIKNAIRNKQILPKRKLSEAVLGEILGMSRTPVRAALKRLEHEGYVEIIPNRGAYVIEPSLKEIDDTYEVRKAIEQLAVSLTIDRLTEEGLAELEECIQYEEEAYANQDYEKYDDINRSFHMKIAELTKNEMLCRFLRETLNKVDSFILLYDENDSSANAPASFEDHKHIVQLIRAKKTKEAREYIATHLEHARSRLVLDVSKCGTTKDFLS